MKKLFKSYLAIWAILVAAFNLIVFITPNVIDFNGQEYEKFGGAFWVGYALIMLSFAGQLLVSCVFFKEENKGKVFLSMPIYTLSRAAVIVSVIFGTIFMVIPNLPNWIGAVIGIFVLAFYAIAIIKANAAKEVVAEVGEKVKSQSQFIRMNTTIAQNYFNSAKTDAVKAECKKVYEAFRYSDPMSSPDLALEEAQITLKMSELASAIGTNDDITVKAVAGEIVALISTRNAKCKVLK